MRVLIIEQNSGAGHYLNYVQYLIQAFAPLGCEVVVALPKEAQESAQFKVHLSQYHAQFRLTSIPPRILVKSKWEMMRRDTALINEVIEREKPDAVYLPTGDFGMAQSLGLSRLALRRSALSQVHCEALLMWMSAAYGMSTRPLLLTKAVLQAMPFDIVHYIDPVVFDWVINNVGGEAAKAARFIPDPIEQPSLPSRSKACAMLGLPEHRKIIMSVGVQDHRKGADYLIYACACWQPAEPTSIVLAGKLSAEIRELVSNEYRHLLDSGRLIIFDRYLSNDDFFACFAAGDLIVTPYRPYPGPSGIVLCAAAAGKMVLTTDTGWFSYMVPKFALGSLCDPRDPGQYAATLDVALNDAGNYKVSEATKRLTEFLRPHNFVLQWRRGLSQIMGKPEASPARDWTWVLNGDDHGACGCEVKLGPTVRPR